MSQVNMTNLAERIDSEVETYMDHHQVGALVVGLVGADDSVPPVKGYGVVDPSGELVPTGSSIFEIGSVTKTFTGAALAWLARPGGPLESIEDQAQRYVPNAQGGGVTIPVWHGKVPVTLVDLADFAPGFPSDSSGHGIKPHRTYLELFQEINTRGNALLVAQPGTTYSYSDAAFELLGSIIAYVNAGDQGYCYGALLRAFLEAACLAMPDTVVVLDEEQQARLVPGFHDGKRINYTSGDWLIVSTGDDMLVWLHYQMDLLSSPLNTLLQVIQQPRIGLPGGQVQTGLGLFFQTTKTPDGLTKYWKNGAAEGYSSYITFSTGSNSGWRIGVVVLTNEKDANPSELGNTLFGLLSGTQGSGASDGPTFAPEEDA